MRWFLWAAWLCQLGLLLSLGVLVGFTLGSISQPPPESDPGESHDAAEKSDAIPGPDLLHGNALLPLEIGQQLLGAVVGLLELPHGKFLVGHPRKRRPVQIFELASYEYFSYVNSSIHS